MIMDEPLLDLCPGKTDIYVIMLSMIQVILVQSRTEEASQLRGDSFQITRKSKNPLLLKCNNVKSKFLQTLSGDMDSKFGVRVRVFFS